MTFAAEQWIPKSKRLLQHQASALGQLLASVARGIIWILVTLAGR